MAGLRPVYNVPALTPVYLYGSRAVPCVMPAQILVQCRKAYSDPGIVVKSCIILPVHIPPNVLGLYVIVCAMPVQIPVGSDPHGFARHRPDLAGPPHPAVLDRRGGTGRPQRRVPSRHSAVRGCKCGALGLRSGGEVVGVEKLVTVKGMIILEAKVRSLIMEWIPNAKLGAMGDLEWRFGSKRAAFCVWAWVPKGMGTMLWEQC
eukprot:1157790-Pelagomonas_calceolata.AAC.12